METKLYSEVINKLKHELGYTQGIAVSSNGNCGGLALLWKPESKVEIHKFSKWYIDAFVDSDNNGDVWHLTGFYGHPNTSKREETWTLLESLASISLLPWLCIGDYNEITKVAEKEGGNERPPRQMARFRGVMHHCGFVDLGFYGAPFTWFKNHSDEGCLKIRLTEGWQLVHGDRNSLKLLSIILKISFRPPFSCTPNSFNEEISAKETQQTFSV